MNWEDLRFFLAIARAGTLSRAAKALGVDQATVSRRLASLEAGLGSRLFIRLPRAARLTPLGEKILSQVMEMESLAFSVERQSSPENLPGRTRIAVSVPPVLSRHFFARHIHALALDIPQIQISVQSEPFFVSLSRLEADLAVRLSMAIDETDIIKKIGRMKFAFYATSNYPHAANPGQWEFIGYPQNPTVFAHKKWLYEVIATNKVICEFADLSNQYEAACSGVGVAGLPCFIADADSRLVKLPCDHALLTLDIWIAKHPDRRDDARVRAVADSIIRLVETEGLGLKE